MHLNSILIYTYEYCANNLENIKTRGVVCCTWLFLHYPNLAWRTWAFNRKQSEYS